MIIRRRVCHERVFRETQVQPPPLQSTQRIFPGVQDLRDGIIIRIISSIGTTTTTTTTRRQSRMSRQLFSKRRQSTIIIAPAKHERRFEQIRQRVQQRDNRRRRRRRRLHHVASFALSLSLSPRAVSFSSKKTKRQRGVLGKKNRAKIRRQIPTVKNSILFIKRTHYWTTTTPVRRRERRQPTILLAK